MNIDFSKSFDNQFQNRLSARQRQQALEAIELFIDKPYHKDLRNHPLYGKWKGYRSISVSGDLRLHFKIVADDRVLFEAVGSHGQLYKR
ncbi:MAG: type II toxin-antitoxin system mRNA interferase toxin, RelE/StbE family [Candidatus Saccharibacteria bacterium]